MRGCKVGEVKEKDADTITADVVTKDNSLVQRFIVDRHTGEFSRKTIAERPQTADREPTVPARPTPCGHCFFAFSARACRRRTLRPA